MQTLQAPTPPTPPTPAPVPWIAAITPVALAVVMAVIFRQALALIMGLVGPAMVLGSWFESRRQASRSHERATEEYAKAHAEYLRDVEGVRSREKTDALALLPSLLEAASQPLWRRSALTERGCRIGLGFSEFPEGHPLWGHPGLAGMPRVLDVTQNVALVGEESCSGVWRTLAVGWALAHGLTLRADEHGELPTHVIGAAEAHWVATLEDVPEQCRIVVVCSDKPTVEVKHSGVPSFSVIPDELSIAEAVWILRRFLALDESPEPDPSHDISAQGRLWFQLSDTSPTWDLVREGPHAVVWGATGSGKSVTVTALVGSLVARYPPENVVCVLIDFKGGAGLRALQDLPHTIGSITDIEGSGASRALTGLHCELLRREKILHAHGVTDVADLDPSVHCPRLVVVIDEAAWLLTTFPEFQPALADVLARGRSLGVHVIISTQRVTGVLSAAMMANISLRICGRVPDEQDALTWIPDLGPSLRAGIRHGEPGEVILAGASAPPSLHRVESRLPRHREAPPSSWRVWADPLPAVVSFSKDVWGIADDVPAQSHRPLERHEAPPGSTLVIGDPARGKTQTLATLAALQAQPLKAPGDPLLLWRWWRDVHNEATVVLDDADVTLARAGTDGAHLLLEMLDSHSGMLLMSSRPESAHHRALARLCQDTLVLGVAKAEVRGALGGGSSLAPGRARYREEDIQCAYPAPVLADAKVPWSVPGSSGCVVTRSPQSWSSAPLALVLSPEELARRWQEVVDCEEIILDRISPVEVRGATLGRIHPPPLPVPDDVVLVWRKEQFDVARRAWWRD